MENNIKNLKPEKVFKFFSEICAIPHGSGNLDNIVNYLVNFAKERKLKYVVDDVKNVIIYKNAGLIYNSDNANTNICKNVDGIYINNDELNDFKNPVILQAHTDMVCVSAPYKNVDMTKEPIELIVDGNLLTANGTSLGADDGIGVAMILAILDEEDEKFPAIEAVFTSDEETGLNGAVGIDGKLFKGKTLINIDSEDEGVLTVSCAGGSQCVSYIPIVREGKQCEQKNYKLYSLKVTGLLGGHSGMEIHKGRANAIVEMAYILKKIHDNGLDYYLSSIVGGKFENVICPESTAILYVNKNDILKLENSVKKIESDLKEEYKLTDENIYIELCEISGTDELCEHNILDKKFLPMAKNFAKNLF